MNFEALCTRKSCACFAKNERFPLMDPKSTTCTLNIYITGIVGKYLLFYNTSTEKSMGQRRQRKYKRFINIILVETIC